MSRKRSACGKLRIEFDEVAVGVAIAGHHLAERGDGGEGISLVDPVEQRHVDVAKIPGTKTGRRASKRDAPRQARDRFAARCECRKRSCSSRRTCPGTAASSALPVDEANAFTAGRARCALLANAQHFARLCRRPSPRFAAPPAAATRKAMSPVPPATSRCLNGRCRDGRTMPTKVRLPQPVHASRHEVVHQVITRCNIAENAVNQVLFFGERHPRIAEMRLFA